MEESPHDAYDYIYDQVVSIGELVSSRILYHAMVAAGGIKAAWLDIRGVLYTDEIHREAKVIWQLSTEKIARHVRFDENLRCSSDAGFYWFYTGKPHYHIGAEGSDYTAAILSYCCQAKAMHIWKDVPGY